MHRKSASSEADSARVFAALGDPIRLRLVSRLCKEGPLSITELASGERVTRQAITKHLRFLEEVSVIKGHREGRQQIWELESKRLEIAQKYLERISRGWDDALIRLKKFVED